MKIDLIGALDYNALQVLLNEKVKNGGDTAEIIDLIRELEISRRSQIVAAAGRLSRFAGNVFESLGVSETNSLEKNVRYIKNITKMGHNSITDHDYCVFAIQDVSPVIEQIIIAERFSSFTIKSRREVDFSKVGFYTPDFHGNDGEVLANNNELQRIYKAYMQSLFTSYEKFISYGIPKEDARFVLPYCYHSNILMGVDAHTLKDMIIKFTKTKYAKVQEVREFGERLYAIAKQNMPYLIEEIDTVDMTSYDDVDKFLMESAHKHDYKVLTEPKLLAHTNNPDEVILTSALMRRYQYTQEQAKAMLDYLAAFYPNYKEELMKKIAFNGDRLELAQVNFQFQIPLSFAVLTHLTRHRTHHILVPDFFPVGDLGQYKIPPKIIGNHEREYHEIFDINQRVLEQFRKCGVREEDLVYFTLSGNMVNVVTNMDGKTVAHILGLRECNKAQWETKEMAYGMHKQIASEVPEAALYEKILGATCTTQGFCKEGKESCGRIKQLEKVPE